VRAAGRHRVGLHDPLQHPHVRRVGHTVSERQIEAISASIAAPVYSADSQVVAALSIMIPADVDTREYGAALR